MSKFLDLLNDNRKSPAAPRTDFHIAVVATSNKTVIVECDRYREMWEVEAFVKSQRSGSWMAGFWDNTGEVGGSNPYEVAGVWKYLMVQA